MALKLIATYSKRLGLPGYSSHQFSVCVETEISSNDDIPGESARLYRTLQQSVDEEIQAVGFVPGSDYGADSGQSPQNGGTTAASNGTAWACSDRQRDLILRIVEEHQLDRRDVDELAQTRFGKGIRQLNKLEASGLIDELLEKHGGGRNASPARNGSRFRRNTAPTGKAA